MSTGSLLQFRQQLVARRQRLLDGRGRLGQLPPQWGTEWTPIVDRWMTQIDALVHEVDEPIDVVFTLLGGTGAGKSTLINALLGTELLPVSSMQACTAAVCEIGFQPAGVKVEVEFVSEESWRNEINQLAQQLLDDRGPGDGTAATESPADRNSPMAAKLEAVFPREQVDAFFAHADPSVLVEPPATANLLLAGRSVTEFPDSDSARKLVEALLSSEPTTADQGPGVQWWPLVKLTRISGPFDALRTGAKLVDLPGLNDPNAAREAVTRHYLETSNFVWVVYDMRRVLTGDMTGELEKSGLFRRLVTEGREGALSFVGTSADQISPKADRTMLGLPPDASFKEIALARRAKSAELVRAQLMQLATRLGESSSAAAGTAHTSLNEAVAEFPILTVSAQNYLTLRGLFESTTAPILDDEPSTGIPALVNHLQQTVERNVGDRRTDRLRLQFAQIEADVHARISAFRSSRSLGSLSKEEVAAAGNNAARFLDAQFQSVLASFDSSLATANSRFESQFAADVASASGVAQVLYGRWRSMPWNTLQACCRRGGTFIGSTGSWDIGGEVSAAVMSCITLTWADFFGRELTGLVGSADASAAQAIAEYRLHLAAGFDEFMPDDAARQKARSLASQDVATRLLATVDAATPAALDTIRKSQSTLSRWIERELQAGLAPAYAQAAGQYGDGMRDRMAGILFEATRTSLEATLQRVHHTLREQTAGLRAELTARLEHALRDAHTSAVQYGEDLVRSIEQAHADGVDRMAVLLTEWVS
jgi:hypothetical protein